jgi:DNA topoisomerase-1
MQLVIVESPTKARTLSRFLSSRYQILASMGHVRDLPKKKLGQQYRPTYVQVPGKRDVIAKLKQAAAKADVVILATDPDREGEAIAYHVLKLLTSKTKHLKPARITFHEITRTAVKQALQNPGEVNMALVHAQQARRVLDRLVGYQLSPLLWRKIRKGLSAGRVQSVAVRLIVERERQIKMFVPEDFWEFYALVYARTKNEFFTAKLIKVEDRPAEVKDQKQAKVIETGLNRADYQIQVVKSQSVSQNPPPPFITSTLQRTAANLFKYSARRTMSIAQRLYEAGLITYHRTDSVTLSGQATSILRNYIKKEFSSRYLPPAARVYKTKSKSAQEAHEAIRPTKLVYRRQLKPEEARLFELIKNRALCSQMASAVWEKTTIDILAGSSYLLRKTSQVLQFDGFLKLWGKSASQSDPEAEALKGLQTGDKLKLKKLKIEAKQTQPPSRYTEAGLIKALEDRGIGRPSTYAPIITTVQRRQYVEKQEGRFLPTPVGMAVTGFLEKHFDKVMDYDFTAKMEDNLDKVAAKEEQWHQVVDEFYQPFAKTLKSVGEHSKRVEIPTEKVGKKCPECEKGEQVIRVGRFGKFLSCSRFPDCKWKDTYREVVKDVKCLDCGGQVLVRQTKRGKRFYGCSAYPKCQWASWRKPKQ